ncbi:MAG: 30S ribosomal protein S8 [Planctomycetota bacterium]
MSQDPIADFLAAFKNAIQRNKVYFDFPASKILDKILMIMRNNGYVENHKKITDNKQGFFRIFPAYSNGIPVLKGTKRVSKLGRRIYVPVDRIPRVLDDYGVAVISTSKGVVEGKDAKNMNAGGEVICYFW